MTSDLQSQILDQGCFAGPAGTSNQIQDFTGLPPATMETGSMGELPNQEVQNQQPCKYDLLSSVPRESESQGCNTHNSLQGFLVDLEQNPPKVLCCHPLVTGGTTCYEGAATSQQILKKKRADFHSLHDCLSLVNI